MIGNGGGGWAQTFMLFGLKYFHFLRIEQNNNDDDGKMSIKSIIIIIMLDK